MAAIYPPPRDGIKWKDLGFCLATKDTNMVMCTCTQTSPWGTPQARPYGAFAIEPSATILNYGQGIFEGLKAYRTEKGRIVVFRPQANAKRFADGAKRLLMPPVPEKVFLEAVALAVRENADWVPPGEEGSMYLRPLLFGSGTELGVKPSPEYTFLIFVSPVSSYFSGGARMQLCIDHQRAAPMGTGHVKAPGNYAPCMALQAKAKASGFSDIIYLDASGKYIEEAAASNFFCVDKDGVLRTPELGTILAGITRESIIHLCKHHEIDIKVGPVTVDDVLGATEAFATGTGAGVAPIEHISAGEQGKVDLEHPGKITTKILNWLQDIRLERSEDAFKWLYDPFKSERARASPSPAPDRRSKKPRLGDMP